MASERLTPIPEDAFCIACGYPLRGLVSNRCPECGRTFDPANPRSMTLGCPLRLWQRALLRPISWPTVTLAIAGSLGLFYLSGWPGLWPESPILLAAEFHLPPVDLKPTVPDVVFYAAIILWAMFLVLVIPGQLGRLLLVPRIARVSNVPEINPRRRRRAIIAAAVVSGCCLVFGWEGRIGRRWIARVPSVSSGAGWQTAGA